jgi:hypothetical protein
MNEFSAEATLFEGIFFAQGVKRTECIVSLRGALDDIPHCAVPCARLMRTRDTSGMLVLASDY